MKEEQVINIDGSDGRPINITAEDGSSMTVNISSTFHTHAYPQWLDEEVERVVMEAIKAAKGG